MSTRCDGHWNPPLDLACGSAPLQPGLSSRRDGGRYVGADLSAGELTAARRAGRGPLVRADATAIPLTDGGVDTVVCSMGLMILPRLPAALSEIRRVLVPGGLLVATVPAAGPLRLLDVLVVGGLLAGLGRALSYPNDAAMRRMAPVLARAGLRLEADERYRFGYRPRDAADADGFLSSLYLPGLPDRRYRRARTYLRALTRAGVELPIPIRRIVARAEDMPR
ncbi:MAG: methyltransferase domain-containing protein [Streptosporangiales bacterium]|nr:methyltransferase domain-containing protein [Streptosporangiales bacterium]